MTPEQVDLVRKSFDSTWPMGRDIADLCYSRFFELTPDARESGECQKDTNTDLTGFLDRRASHEERNV
jgi:hypothetical protein